MPSGPMLYADQLLEAVRRKHLKGGYKEVTGLCVLTDISQHHIEETRIFLHVHN
jgi:hypothetical protein